MVLAPNKALPGKKEEQRFTAGPAASYPSHQTSENVTIGVKPYFDNEETRPVFGKNNPYNYGVLPVLVVIQNDSGKTIKFTNLKVEYVGPGSARIEATPARDIRYLNGVAMPTAPSPIKLGKKNPLNAWEIEGRAFAAESLPSGNSAYGFFYFQTPLQHDATIYLSGMTEAGTGKELLYFEVPLFAPAAGGK